MFNSESKSISAHTTRRQVEGMEANSYVVLRKSLLNEDNWGKKIALISWGLFDAQHVHTNL